MKQLRRTRFIVCTLVLLSCLTSSASCNGAPAKPDSAPAPLRSLRLFGAYGDGLTDDTAALRKALSQSEQFCLDGEGRTYSVRGTLRASKNLCLLNMRLVQHQAAYDTRGLIHGSCPPISDPAALASCGDKVIPGPPPPGLEDYLNVRTLLVRPDGEPGNLSVFMDKVVIDKGSDPRSGSRPDAAGIWIDQANRITLTDVEITGAGKGFGLFIEASHNIALTRLNVHDLTWAPYAGDTDLTVPGVAAKGWNTVPIREFRRAGQDGAKKTGFQGVRVQEQISCVTIVRSHHMVLRDTRIERCGAQFVEGIIPWQADGLTVGGTSSDLTIEGDTIIASTWEGIDLVGSGEGIDRVRIKGAKISDSFSFGVKWGYKLTNAVLEDTAITNSGFAGVVIYGPVRLATVRDVQISGIGTVRFPQGYYSPWRDDRVGLLIAKGAIPGTEGLFPQDVAINHLRVEGGAGCERAYLNKGGVRIRVARSRLEGCVSPSTPD